MEFRALLQFILIETAMKKVLLALALLSSVAFSQEKNSEVSQKNGEVSQKNGQVSQRQESKLEEEAAILTYYNNYLKNYRLGPEDVISIEVFGQCPNYCILNKTIPPTAKISYPLIREGIFVGGKTVEEVAEEITKKLEEYIIDPKVTVTLEKVGSARYSVIGKVNQPGVRLMTRRVSVYEAITEAGGVTKDGNRKRVVIYRQTQTGLKPIFVNLKDLEEGKAEMIYLVPGDQVFVPDAGNKLSASKILKVLETASVVRFLFGGFF